jgi:HK97 family phage portal protein
MEDAKILDAIKFNKADIAALYGIPVFMLGDYEQSKFNSIEYLTKFFNSFTARPLANIWRKELEDKLLTDEEWKSGMSIELNTNALIEMDTTTKMDSYQKLIQNGVIEPGLVAELEGYPAPKTKGRYFLSNNHTEFENKTEANVLANEKLKLELEKLKIELGKLKNNNQNE